MVCRSLISTNHTTSEKSGLLVTAILATLTRKGIRSLWAAALLEANHPSNIRIIVSDLRVVALVCLERPCLPGHSLARWTSVSALHGWRRFSPRVVGSVRIVWFITSINIRDGLVGWLLVVAVRRSPPGRTVSRVLFSGRRAPVVGSCISIRARRRRSSSTSHRGTITTSRGPQSTSTPTTWAVTTSSRATVTATSTHRRPIRVEASTPVATTPTSVTVGSPRPHAFHRWASGYAIAVRRSIHEVSVPIARRRPRRRQSTSSVVGVRQVLEAAVLRSRDRALLPQRDLLVAHSSLLLLLKRGESRENVSGSTIGTTCLGDRWLGCDVKKRLRRPFSVIVVLAAHFRILCNHLPL